MQKKRIYPIGAEYSEVGTDFRVWAPQSKKVTLVIEENGKIAHKLSLKKEKKGYFSLYVPKLPAGTLYRFKLGNSKQLLPDPASRYQPLGVKGPSCVVNRDYSWSDKEWKGITIDQQIIYELHLGTFTKEGTFKAAQEKLPYLLDLGITVIEIMPINEFPGHFGWGYDGVYLFAPYHFYGTPTDVKDFINKAHNLGIAVILDVVYNHFGPAENYFSEFSKNYYQEKKITDWGKAINFDDPSSREYFITNAKYWIEEFHFDGFRVDATPQIFSETSPHILKELTLSVRNSRPKHKKRIVIAENETQDVTLLHSYKKKGYQFDALWNDDFHHTACVRLKGIREAYYTDYLGSPQEFISSLKYGFLYQGQYYSWQKKFRGKPDLELPYSAFVVFLENHDQIANTSNGKRLYQLCDYGAFKALSSLLLLGPNTPMIFQGQEFGSSAPFQYFADHTEDLNILIFKGRKEFLAQFPSLSSKEASKKIKTPFDPLTFTECKLDFSEKEKHAEHFALYKDLILLRKKDPVFSSVKNITIDGAVLSADAFLIRYFGGKLGDRLIIVNFGPNLTYNPSPEPLLASRENMQWEFLWSSESVTYGGTGVPPINTLHLTIPGHSSLILKTVPLITK